ncbi:MAG: hypothetical protein PWR20_671 [Bacteroidales bacterium]|jgi:hypothetical protein|nr:hypothetical protein [Bacteroidales bacterium]MDN5328784.1 hypothetical protein [Bacteroidales bacterium]
MLTKIKHRLVFIVQSAALCTLGLQAQVLPEERRTDWSLAGTHNVLFSPITLNILDFGADSTGSVDNSVALSSALNALLPAGGTIYFPPGNYLFTSTVSIPSGIRIKGAGAALTKILFNNQGLGDCLVVAGTSTNISDTLIGDYNKDSRILIVKAPLKYVKGDYIKIFEDDGGRIFSGWASHSIGQIVRIDSVKINSHELIIDQPLRQNYSASLYPRILKLNPARNVGFECFTLKRLDYTNEQTSNIDFNMAVNCYVLGIESYYTNYAHIRIENSSQITVCHSYFKEALSYGSGGKGYGIALQATSGLCLIENNQFEHLRHSILLQSGANGNVVAYNYSIDPFWTGTFLPSNSAGDLVLHGNYPYMNLFEGNICQNIVVDNSHGINGPYNTFFRNRAQLYGIFMNTNPASDNQNFIANEITNPIFGLYLVQGNGHLEYGNNQNGVLIPPDTDTLTIKSLYKNSVPEYWDYTYVWPGIGISYFLNYNLIPSYINHQKGIHSFCTNESDTMYKNFLICPSKPFIFNNHTYNQAGIFTDSLRDFKNENHYLKIHISVPKAPQLTIENDTLKTSANGLFYNWYKNNVWIAGTTSNTLGNIQAGTYYVEKVDSNFCALRSDSLVVSPYGLLNNSPSKGINFFPNPFTDKIYIEQKKNNYIYNKIILINQQGYIVYQNNEICGKTSLELNLKHLPPGLYFIQMISDQATYKSYYLKVLKQ